MEYLNFPSEQNLKAVEVELAHSSRKLSQMGQPTLS